MSSEADKEQAGGDHYKRMEIEPWNVIDTWPLAERIGFYRGNLLKYTMRLHDKDDVVDNAAKAGHYARKLEEVLQNVTTAKVGGRVVSPDDFYAELYLRQFKERMKR